ncbi:AI-2E family transporter [Litorilituus lipolyticus]|uniref:AI-2E family transporter n=1 Tax=Litorilituus lipolyticus TaxID=2491017 RepID=A0A502L8Z2_9GAMM|nr:AI-2E family transporter [Litorilituus lipolyticus]TPH18553.1 AI-2E family transporter [Litorilituus lipolyticus]
MSLKHNITESQTLNQQVIDAAIKLGAVALLIGWCFAILRPFILIVLWGAILAVALKPIHNKLTKVLKGKVSIASTVIAVVGIALIVVPAVNLSASSIESAQYIYNGIEDGTLKIPQANESVKQWPIIGEQSYALWQAASQDIQKVASQYSEQIKTLSASLLSAAAGLGGGILQFIISLIIAVVFMAKADISSQGLQRLMFRLMGENGQRTITTTVATIRSVAMGVLGVAVIQSLLAGIGLLIADIPAAGIWASVILILAIAQLPPIIILGPIAAYYFSVADTTPAIIFLIYSIVVSSSDAFLKPLFLGRGMDIPMLVILLGAIGGMLLSGIIGLFVGAVVLALGYQLMLDWLSQNSEDTEGAANETL